MIHPLSDRKTEKINAKLKKISFFSPYTCVYGFFLLILCAKVIII